MTDAIAAIHQDIIERLPREPNDRRAGARFAGWNPDCLVDTVSTDFGTSDYACPMCAGTIAVPLTYVWHNADERAEFVWDWSVLTAHWALPGHPGPTPSSLKIVSKWTSWTEVVL